MNLHLFNSSYNNNLVNILQVIINYFWELGNKEEALEYEKATLRKLKHGLF